MMGTTTDGAPGTGDYARGEVQGRQEALEAIARIIERDVPDPLTTLLLHLDLSAGDRSRPPEAVQARLETATREAERLQAAVSRLMALASGRAETKPLPDQAHLN